MATYCDGTGAPIAGRALIVKWADQTDAVPEKVYCEEYGRKLLEILSNLQKDPSGEEEDIPPPAPSPVQRKSRIILTSQSQSHRETKEQPPAWLVALNADLVRDGEEPLQIGEMLDKEEAQAAIYEAAKRSRRSKTASDKIVEAYSRGVSAQRLEDFVE